MRSAVVLLGFLLASAQAFYIPARTRPALNSQPSSFLGQTAAVAPRAAPSARRAILVASLEDIEKKLIADEKAAVAAAKAKVAPSPKSAPAPAPAPKAKPSAMPKAAPPAPVAVVAPAPAPVLTPAKKSSGAVATGEVAEGVALGALPWVVAPVVALAALRPVISKGVAARDAEQKAKAIEEAKAAEAAARAAKMEGLTAGDEGAVKALSAVAAVCLGGLLVQPLFAPPDLASLPAKPTPTVQTKKADPAPAPAPAPKKEEPAPAPKPEPAPAPAPAPAPKPGPGPGPGSGPCPGACACTRPCPCSGPGPAPAPAPAPAKKSKKEEPAAPAYSGPTSGRVLEAETLSPDALNMLKSVKKK